MVLDGEGGKQKVYKPTGWCSNAPHVLKHLNKLCTHDHVHASLLNGKARLASILEVGGVSPTGKSISVSVRVVRAGEAKLCATILQ